MIECSMAWRGASLDVNGSWRPCCRYAQPNQQMQMKTPYLKDSGGNLNSLHNSDHMIALRNALSNDQRVNECKWCWDEEDAGIKSYREIMNEIVSKQKIKIDYTNPIAESPVYLDLKLNNVCNLKCRMCGPVASSMIQKEWELIDSTYKGDSYWKEYKIVNTENQESFIEWLPNVFRITITGGDPFVGKENRDLVKLISDSGYASKIKLDFNTNGMFMPKSLLNILSKFREVEISFSIDDVGERLTYQRHGADLKTIIDNWNAIPDNSVFKKSIVSTINSYNIWYYIDAHKELKQLTDNIRYDFVHNPMHLNISCLPLEIKNILITKYTKANDAFWDKIISVLQLDQKNRIIDFLNDTERLDELRNENFTRVFPEFASELMKHGWL